jgi:hypothetical protein
VLCNELEIRQRYNLSVKKQCRKCLVKRDVQISGVVNDWKKEATRKELHPSSGTPKENDACIFVSTVSM